MHDIIVPGFKEYFRKLSLLFATMHGYQSFGMSLIIYSLNNSTAHSMEEAEALCDRLGIFVDGSLQCIADAKEVNLFHQSPLFSTAPKIGILIETMHHFLSYLF